MVRYASLFSQLVAVFSIIRLTRKTFRITFVLDDREGSAGHTTSLTEYRLNQLPLKFQLMRSKWLPWSPAAGLESFNLHCHIPRKAAGFPRGASIHHTNQSFQIGAFGEIQGGGMVGRLTQPTDNAGAAAGV